MAYFFTRASSQCIRNAAPTIAAPLSMAIRIRPNNVSVYQSAAILSRAAGSFGSWDVIRVSVRGDLSGDPFQLSVLKNSTAVEIQGGAATVGQWASVVAIQTSATSRELWVNGVQVATSTTSVAPANFDAIRLGCAIGLSGATEDAFFDGDLADFGLWNVALTSAEIASLNNGFPVSGIRPPSLLRDIQLVRNVQDIRAGSTVTAINSPTVSAHPRNYP